MTYPRSPKMLKGSLIVLESAGVIGMVPRLIAFQFNPSEITRTLSPYGSEEAQSSEESPRNEPFDPKESFTLNLVLDASSALEQPDENPIPVALGVAHEIAAFEQLLYPVEQNFLGFGNADVGFRNVRPARPPIVLFAWGPSRIVPIKITSYSVEETVYSPALYPIRAKIALGCKVLTPSDFNNTDESAQEVLAVAAYKFTMAQKEIMASQAVLNVVDELVNLGSV